MTSKEQLEKIRAGLIAGGFVMGKVETSVANTVIHGRVGTLEVRAIINNLGTDYTQGSVMAFRDERRAEYGRTLARFSCGKRGFKLTNKILDITLDRVDPFGA